MSNARKAVAIAAVPVALVVGIPLMLTMTTQDSI